jgi:hypothetical protein
VFFDWTGNLRVSWRSNDRSSDRTSCERVFQIPVERVGRFVNIRHVIRHLRFISDSAVRVGSVYTCTSEVLSVLLKALFMDVMMGTWSKWLLKCIDFGIWRKVFDWHDSLWRIFGDLILDFRLFNCWFHSRHCTSYSSNRSFYRCLCWSLSIKTVQVRTESFALRLLPIYFNLSLRHTFSLRNSATELHEILISRLHLSSSDIKVTWILLSNRNYICIRISCWFKVNSLFSTLWRHRKSILQNWFDLIWLLA